MVRFRLLIGLLLFVSFSFGQISYSGIIDKYPIELAIEIYPEGTSNGVYVYTNIDEPIDLNGKLTGAGLILYEKDRQKKNTGVFTFARFRKNDISIEGTWKNLLTGKQLKVILTKKFDIEGSFNGQYKDEELIVPSSLKNQYFKLLLTMGAGDASTRVTGIKIFEKKTDQLVQQLEMDCAFIGFNTLQLGDFNFDGFTDFSVFETSYAGPNTSSIYFLYNPQTKLFFESGFSGVSLQFDAKTKTIVEENQCCAGSKLTRVIYKVVKNKMVVKAQYCFTWNENKNMLVKQKWKNCE
ncbi:MAG: hypothetical protein ABIN94_04125 [Ferruginibacter sp.]